MTPYGNRKPRGDVKTLQRMQFHRTEERQGKGEERQMENGMSNKSEKREKRRKGEREREAEKSARLLDEQQS